MKPHDEKLIWEAYIKEDDLSHGQYTGPDELEPMARIEPQEMGEERPDDLESFEEGDLVEIHPRVGGGLGEIVEMSPSGTHGIIELSEDMEDGLAQGDRVAVHISDLSHVNGEEEPVDVDDLNPEDDVPYESANIKENKKPEDMTQAEWNAQQAGHSIPKGTPKSPMKKWKEKNKDKPGKAYPGDEAAAKELDEGVNVKERLGGGQGYQSSGKPVVTDKDTKKVSEDCGCPALGGNNEPKAHGIAVRMHDDDLTDDKRPVVKVVKMKKKPALPGKIMRAITRALGLESTVNEQEYEERQPFFGRQLSRDEEESEGWTAEETIEWHSQDVIAAGADFLDQELLDPKVNSLDDVHQDLLDDLAGMVIHQMQKDGKLPKRLDYNDYMDERDEYKNAIEDHLGAHFSDMVDLAEDRAAQRGDRPTLG